MADLKRSHLRIDRSNVKRTALTLALCAIGLVVAGCAEPDSSAGSGTTARVEVSTTETTPATTVATLETTTTTVPVTTTTVPSTASTPIPISGPEPEINLKPPGLMDGFSLENLDDVFIFRLDVDKSYTTHLLESARVGESTITARVDDQYSHFTLEGVAEGEFFVGDGAMWARDQSGAWVSDDLQTVAMMVVGEASPDSAYGYAYHAFDHMAFEGWIESGGDRLALYRGGPAAAIAAGQGDVADAGEYDGSSVEAWWSPDGYFARVKLRIVAENELVSDWTITDVGTTEVELPPSSGAG
jgi:hypothetical protein